MVQANAIAVNVHDDPASDLITQAATELTTQGWAVVPGVLSTAECSEYVNGAWSWLESLGTGIDRDDPATWGVDRWPASFRGIINTLEVSHQDFVWRVRQNPKILQGRLICRLACSCIDEVVVPNDINKNVIALQGMAKCWISVCIKAQCCCGLPGYILHETQHHQQ